jgi:hypothetical protein
MLSFLASPFSSATKIIKEILRFTDEEDIPK